MAPSSLGPLVSPPPVPLPVPLPRHPSRSRGRARRLAEDASGGTGEEGSGDGEGGDEEEEEEVGLTPGAIPEVPFDGAPSVRFVFSARLDPAPERPGRKKGGKGQAGGKSKGGKGNRTLLEELKRRDLKGGGGGGGNAAGKGPIFSSLETEWTPLTRIREEHAPMPAPETKCMQVMSCVTIGVLSGVTLGVSSGVAWVYRRVQRPV